MPPLLKRLATLLSLGALLGLIGCSSLTLAYNQLPLLAGLWADRYLDLDGGQEKRQRKRTSERPHDPLLKPPWGVKLRPERHGRLVVADP